MKNLCCPLLKGRLQALPTNDRLGLKGSRLLQKFATYGRNIVYNIDHWAQRYETFYVRNLQVFVIS